MELNGLDSMEERLGHLQATHGGRALVGLVGAPGAGKSTLAALLAARLRRSCVVPMDGFHLSNAVLKALGRLDRKGAPDTFDAEGFKALLMRIGQRGPGDVYYPVFHREMEESIAAEGVVSSENDVVLVEGLYLLHWGLKDLFTEVWFIDVDNDVRVERLIERRLHLGYGRNDAEAWARGSDARNADVVNATRAQADRTVRFDK